MRCHQWIQPIVQPLWRHCAEWASRLLSNRFCSTLLAYVTVTWPQFIHKCMHCFKSDASQPAQDRMKLNTHIFGWMGKLTDSLLQFVLYRPPWSVLPDFLILCSIKKAISFWNKGESQMSVLFRFMKPWCGCGTRALRLAACALWEHLFLRQCVCVNRPGLPHTFILVNRKAINSFLRLQA